MTLHSSAADLTGRRFGKLTALRPTEARADNRIVWECVCDCGKETTARSSNLVSGSIRSCGCLRSESMRRLKAGDKYARLTVISYAKSGHYKCRCDCGVETVVLTSNLRAGKVKSCGCYRDEISRTHGMSNTSIYRRWNAMMTRCYDPRHPSFNHYGGRGIRVCERWRTFENFYADLGDPPPGMSIDRIDVNGWYSPENCRWATGSTQASNKRRARQVAIDNLTIEELEAILAAKKQAALGVFG